MPNNLISKRSSKLHKKNIINDVIQPVHIKVKPVLQEGIKPTIFKGFYTKETINQKTQNLNDIYK